MPAIVHALYADGRFRCSQEAKRALRANAGLIGVFDKGLS